MLLSAVFRVFALIKAGKSIQPCSVVIALVLHHEKCHLSVFSSLVLGVINSRVQKEKDCISFTFDALDNIAVER